MEKKMVKLVIYVPETHADAVREALGRSGAGKFGHYEYCSFSINGFGRFRPLKGAHPTIGQIGKVETVREERIETVCGRAELKKILTAVKKVHPYEEIAFDVYPLI